jgi:hypothetical protein
VEGEVVTGQKLEVDIFLYLERYAKIDNRVKVWLCCGFTKQPQYMWHTIGGSYQRSWFVNG